MKRVLIVMGAVSLMAAVTALAGDPPATGKSGSAAGSMATSAAPVMEHRSFTPADMKWSDPPPGLPKGSKMMVLEGNPAEPGPFTMRAWLPDGYKVMPHWHPSVEHVTVISGTFYMAMGESWDESKGHALPAGSFSYMPAGMKHYAWSKGETVIQVHGVGPWGITYVNPSDDPRNQKQATK